MSPLISSLLLFSVLVPSKLWFAPNAPIPIDVKADRPVTLRLTDFAGKAVDAKADAAVAANKTVDLNQLFPNLAGGAYVLYAVPDDKSKPFVGTPLVIESRSDRRPGTPPGPLVYRVSPLRYAVMDTDQGAMTLAFYHDSAPNTVDNFLRLSDEGFYDGIAFHRIIPGFVLQAGDPLSLDEDRAGTGGPGYSIPAEFNNRPHLRGALSMARSQSPDSASSQFFVCLDYAKTQQLDGQYTVFGTVTDGDDTITKLAGVRTGSKDRPLNPPKIKSLTVRPVTAEHNPYEKIIKAK